MYTRDSSSLFADDPKKKYEEFCHAILPGVQQKKGSSLRMSRAGGPPPEDRCELTAQTYAAIYDFYVQQYLKKSTDTATQFMSREEFYQKITELFKAAATEQNTTEGQINDVNDILEDNLIVGEISHSCITPKQFLIENMQALKAAGYTTLYFEHLYYDQHQYLLDKLSSGESMNQHLVSRLDQFDHAYSPLGKFQSDWMKSNFTAVVKAAQDAGIRVVALDIKSVYELQDRKMPGGGRDAENRTIMGDYCFARIIQHDQQEQKRSDPHGKYVALIGAAHVAGLTQLLDEHVTTVLIGDGTHNDVRFHHQNRLLTGNDIPDMEYSALSLLPRTDVLILSSKEGRVIPVLTGPIKTDRQGFPG